MIGIRAHFDGAGFTPDEPVDLPANAQVVVLVDSAISASAELERQTREYYQAQSVDDAAEDDAWGQALAGDNRAAWENH